MSKSKYWFMAIRPKTLAVSVCPIFLGTVLAIIDGYKINWLLTLCCTLCCLFIQIGTNLFNDAIDFKQGVDTRYRLGPLRVTQAGLIEARSVIIGAVFVYILAMVFSIPLIIQAGWIIILIGLVSLYSGYAYSAQPFCLASKGLGEVLVMIFFGLIATMGTYYVQTLAVSFASFIAGLQTGSLATVIIAINNLRDIEQDRVANKKTLAVRFGRKFARYEILNLYLFAYVLSLFWVYENKLLALALPLFILPFVIVLIRRIFTTPPERIYNQYLFQSVLLNVCFTALTGTGLLLI